MDKLFNGATLGAFRIIHQIGEGGMAKVYKAYQASMERYVALKVLPSHYAEDPQFIERFNREAHTIAALEHRNILPVYDFGEQDGITYMAMRYVEGGTLKELLNKGRLTMHDILDLMLQICSALDYAHRRGVIHRDVKPSNVIIDGEGAAYLMDFGIAKVLGKSGDLTATGAAIGTPAYMAPEQALGEKVDSRTDIYALGIMLYEMVVGRVPFQADTPMAVLMAQLHDPLPLPREFDASISEPVQAVIIKALSKDREDRYQTANELSEAFRKALQVSAAKVEASTLVTLIREVQTGRPVPSPSAPLAFSSQPGAHPTDPRLKERMEQDYIDGLSAFWVRDWIKARACFQAVLAVDPSYKDAAGRLQEIEKQVKLANLYAQAEQAMQKDDWHTAMEELRQLVALDKEYQESAAMLKTVELKIELEELYAQAEQLHQAGQWQAVVNIFARMKALDPNVTDQKGLLSQAKTSLAEQQRLEKIKALYQRGLEALEAGKWKQALKLFEQVKTQQPGYGDVERLVKRVQDEINRSRQRPAQKTSVPTKVAVVADEPKKTETSAPAIEALQEEPAGAVPLQAQPKPRPVLTIILSILVVLTLLSGIALVAAYATGNLDRAMQSLGLARVESTATPQPELPASPVPVQNMFDDFQASSVSGMIDPDRWVLDGNCQAFSNFGRLVQSGVVRFVNEPSSEIMRCQLWALQGQRVAGMEVGALEAGLDFVEQNTGGSSSHVISLLSDYNGKTLQADCGLRSREDGSLIQIFDVYEVKNDKKTDFVYQESSALYNHWYTTRLLLDPVSMSFECSLDGRSLGTYKPVNGGELREVGFARLLITERYPNSAARTLFDNVRLIPLPGADQWKPADSEQGGEIATNPLCPQQINGWQAEYWDNPNLYGDPIVCSDVAELNFNWEMNRPVPGKIPADRFSARFIRTQEFDGGLYRFRLGGDDGVRLWVDDRLVIDQWHDQPYTIYSAELELSPGPHTLRVLYYEAEMTAVLSLTIEKDPDRAWSGANLCVQPNASLVDWWAGDGDGSNDRLGPELLMDHNVIFSPGMVAGGFRFESPAPDQPAFAPWIYPDPRLVDLHQLTIETWVKLEETGVNEQNIHRKQLQERALSSVERFVSLGNKAVIRKEIDGRLHFYMEIDGSLRHIWSDALLPRGEFIHVAATYDGKWMVLYWNGEKVGALEISGQVAPADYLYLSSETETLFGMLDEVSLYSKALTPEQIFAIYAAGHQGKCK